MSLSALRFPTLFEIRENDCIVNMMLSLSWLHCTVPHDRIYAARHLLCSDEIKALIPDYSLPIEQLFSAATAILLQQRPNCGSGSPSILLALACLSKNSHGTEWPTWVPDYHNIKSEMASYLLQYDRSYYRPNFNNIDHRMHVKWRPSNWRTVQIKGRPFSTIYKVLETSVLPRMIDCHLEDMISILEYGLDLYCWYDRCRKFVHDAAGSATRSILENLFSCGRDGLTLKLHKDFAWPRAKRADGIVTWWPHMLPLPVELFDLEGASVLQKEKAHSGILIPSELISLADKFELKPSLPSIVLIPLSAYEKAAANTDIINDAVSSDLYHVVSSREELPPDVFKVIAEVQSILGPIWRWGIEPRMEDRRVLCSFATTRGIRFGWVPPNSRPDDELCYFSGAPLPFVVRKVDGSDAKALIGDAWVHDISEWEARSLTEPVRREILAAFWPYTTSLYWSRFPRTMERLIMRTQDGRERAMRMFQLWEEMNMGWITLK